jgi:hypothetical protein
MVGIQNLNGKGCLQVNESTHALSSVLETPLSPSPFLVLTDQHQTDEG